MTNAIISGFTVEQYRRFYAEEIRFTGNLHSAALVEAFAQVPREDFLGPAPWEIASAEIRGMSVVGGIQMSYTPIDHPRDLYHNVVVVVDKAGDINNGQPSALARWIDALDLKPGDRACHLGCGIGYYTAIMAEVVGTCGSVVATEVNPELAVRAEKSLSSYSNVTVVAGDGATFDPGMCDALLINAGVTHPIPLWLDRLNEGGRLVVPLTISTTPTLGVGVMVKIVRKGGFSAQIITQVAIYSCASARDAQREPQLRVALASGTLMKMKSVRRDAHEQTDTCVLHGADVCLSGTEIE
jgi:protein-L-isoaspartate(D-aspartate) O-methyltransferase